jgi:nucleoside-diphosphate-sugar epimerase
MRGLFFFRFGSKDARMDFVHVKNLSKAHILALERLERASTQNTKTVLSSTSSLQGQAYFISDGEEERIHNFDFFSQLPVGLGYRKPFLTIPFHLMYLLAFLFEILYSLWPHFEPLLTRAEVLKAGVSHWFRIDKARQELGYQPSKFRFDEVLEQFRSETDHRQEKKHSY